MVLCHEGQRRHRILRPYALRPRRQHRSVASVLLAYATNVSYILPSEEELVLPSPGCLATFSNRLAGIAIILVMIDECGELS